MATGNEFPSFFSKFDVKMITAQVTIGCGESRDELMKLIFVSPSTAIFLKTINIVSKVEKIWWGKKLDIV